MKPKLVIFDMDGLIFDTGRLTYRACLETAKQFHFSMEQGMYYAYTGRKEASIRQRMRELYGQEQPIDEWRESIIAHREKILEKEQRVYKKKGLMELLSYLQQEKIPRALASSSPRKVIDWYFQMEEMPDIFDVIISGDEVSQGKPDPEIFLEAAKRMHVASDDCLVLEDSAVGVQAAKAGGMQVYQVLDDLSDMPVYEGDIPILEDLSDYIGKRQDGGPIFHDLLEVRDVLKKG